MWKWEIDYNGHHIAVKNRAFSAELYVDGKLVDSQKGATSSSLISKLPSGESVRAVVNSGVVKIHCNIYVDDVKIFSNS
jgi:hypothetical protein